MSTDTPADRQFCDDVTPPYDYVDETEWDDDEIDEAECGLMTDGQCMLAGTEWCDWDCGKLG